MGAKPRLSKRPRRPARKPGSESDRINPSLKSLAALIGKWDMELSNASFLPDPSTSVHMDVSFEWLEGGAFLRLSQGSRTAGPPYAYWLIGRDESGPDYTVLYSDDRGVSRVYSMSFGERIWKLWRQSPGFSQRFQGELAGDGNTIRAHWEKSTDGRTWEHDFDITYTKRE